MKLPTSYYFFYSSCTQNVEKSFCERYFRRWGTQGQRSCTGRDPIRRFRTGQYVHYRYLLVHTVVLQFGPRPIFPSTTARFATGNQPVATGERTEVVVDAREVPVVAEAPPVVAAAEVPPVAETVPEEADGVLEEADVVVPAPNYAAAKHPRPMFGESHYRRPLSQQHGTGLSHPQFEPGNFRFLSNGGHTPSLPAPALDVDPPAPRQRAGRPFGTNVAFLEARREAAIEAEQEAARVAAEMDAARRDAERRDAEDMDGLDFDFDEDTEL